MSVDDLTRGQAFKTLLTKQAYYQKSPSCELGIQLTRNVLSNFVYNVLLFGLISTRPMYKN